MTARAKIVETHISTLFFYGGHVFKVRKPVTFGFVDFHSIGQRRDDCEREVALNRRLAPDVYLGTATVTLGDDVVEHAVVMRRLPEERNLESIIRAGRPVEHELDEIAHLLAGFHAGAARSPQIGDSATATALWRRWSDTDDELAPYVGKVVDRDRYEEATRLAGRYLEGREALFDARIAAGEIVDGHGDLQAADIFCCDDGPRILDALEFDDSLRYGDWLADVAFLAADLERLHGPDLAGQFLDAYQRCSGRQAPGSLLDFYVAYRAHTRVLVECLRGAPVREDAARVLLEIALRRLRRATVRLVLVGGPPGSGKSTLASRLGSEIDADVISSDVVREGVSPPRGDARRYEDTERERVYEAMFDQARCRLGLGRSVVLDATWTTAAARDHALAVGAEAAADCYELHCTAPLAQRTGRLALRHTGAFGTSDATPALAAVLAATADPWPSALSIDCSKSVEESLQDALSALRSRERPSAPAEVGGDGKTEPSDQGDAEIRGPAPGSDPSGP